MSTPSARRLSWAVLARPAAAVVLALGLTSACSDGDAPPADPDRIVLNPPADGAGHTHAPGEGDPATVGDGTRASAGGYRLGEVRLPRATDGPAAMSFRIRGPDGRTLTDYEVEQTKEMHLYVVRTDYSVFRHLHPTLTDDGTWTVPVDLDAPGRYRVVADFRPAGTERTGILGASAVVPGRWRPEPVPTASEGDDGVVRVAVDGDAALGSDGRLRLVVTTVDGEPVTLGSYLGATAHVSGFRVSGQDARERSFVHVHPYGAPEATGDGTVLTFHTTFEQAGDYRLFVQVRVEGIVHTVPVTATVA